MNLNELDLNKLRTFLAVHSSRSMRSAAESLHLTPSAVSMAISGLERSLGLTLFARSGRRVLPTASGDRLAAVSAKLFLQLSATVDDLHAARGEMRGHVRLGVPGEFGLKVVIPATGRFRRKYPHVTFSVQIGDQNTMIPALLSGHYDLVICDDGAHLTRRPQIVAQPIAKEELVLVCSSRVYNEQIRADHSLMTLERIDHVTYVEHQADLQKWYWHHFRKRPKLRTPMISNHASAVLAAVQADFGLGLVPAYLVKKDVATGRLKLIETGKTALVNEMSILRLKEHLPSRAEQEFLKLLLRGARGGAGAGI